MALNYSHLHVRAEQGSSGEETRKPEAGRALTSCRLLAWVGTAIAPAVGVKENPDLSLWLLDPSPSLGAASGTQLSLLENGSR